MGFVGWVVDLDFVLEKGRGCGPGGRVLQDLSTWGELRDVVDLILQVRAGAYAMEQANPRHEHEWRVWEDVQLPDGKKLVPGVVTHHTNVVEHPELVAQRLIRLAGVVGRDNVLAGTDCGFAQGAFVHRVHEEIQWAKLSALADGARLASEHLWSR